MSDLTRPQDAATVPTEEEKATAWLARRRIGASEAAGLWGASRYSSPYSIWARLTGRAPAARTAGEMVELRRWGHLMEEPIIGEYKRQTARVVTRHPQWEVAVHPGRPYMTATPDARVEDMDGPLQIKTRAFWKGADIAQHGLPLDMNVQVQHEMAVLATDWASVAILVWGRPLVWVDVAADAEFRALHEAKCEALWALVQADTPPPTDGSEATTDAIRGFFGSSSLARVVELDGAMLSVVDALTEAKARAKALEVEIKASENALKVALGDAEMGHLPDGRVVTWKAAPRKGYEVKPTVVRTLRVPAKAGGKDVDE